MGGFSRERAAARVAGKPWNAACRGSATNLWPAKRDGSKAEAEPDCAGANHGEAKAQEGKVGCRSLTVIR